MGNFYGREFEYASTRLRDSVVMLNGMPVYVVDMSRTTGLVSVQHLGGDERRETVPLSDLDVRPVKLGYVNYRGRTCYVMRMPKRRDWRQGLRHSNITSVGKELSVKDLSLSVIAPTIINDYPSFKSCLAAMSKSAKSMAWCRHWCVDKGMSLWYKGVKVGVVVKGEPTLDSKYIHLKESLMEGLSASK